jgi:nucleoside diphosphate kinase
MATQRTLSIIKPDATRRNLTGQINARLEAAGLRIVAQRRIRLSRNQAEAFYEVHKERPFFGGLCAFMTSGPDVRAGWPDVQGGRMSGAHGSDVRGLDLRTNSMNSAWMGQIRGKIRKILWMEIGEKVGDS